MLLHLFETQHHSHTNTVILDFLDCPAILACYGALDLGNRLSSSMDPPASGLLLAENVDADDARAMGEVDTHGSQTPVQLRLTRIANMSPPHS